MPSHIPKYTITTLGCKVNQCESDAIASQLKSCDCLPALKNEPSEICIINTCTVTQKAAMQSRQAVRRAIRLNPAARIIVTGCYAQTEPEAIAKIEGVHDIIGNTDKHSICEMIRRTADRNSDLPLSVCDDIQSGRPLQSSAIAASGGRSRPFFKVQDGCNAFCTYCIVPYARGPSRSMPFENVLSGIEALSNKGYPEIVLTGIHLGHYGHDLTPQTCLGDLLNRIDELNLIPRLRLSSIEPLELTDAIINRVAGSNRFCRHFHIPLQSGDDRILQQMNRPYTAMDFRQRVLKVHERIPEAAIGLDILIGFPGETDRAFSNTYDLVDELPISYLHVFPFSARPGTPAAAYPDTVPPDVIKERCEQMRRLGQAKRFHFFENFIGKTLEILVESTRHAGTGLRKGLSSNYIPVLTNARDDQINQLVTVRLSDQIENALMGRIVKPDCRPQSA